MSTTFLEQRRRRERRRALRPVLLSAAVLAGIGLIGWLLFASPWFRVAQVTVEGTTTLSATEVRRAAAVPADRPLIRVGLEAIQARVESLDVVADAEVSRAWPDGVLIRVTERTPVAVVRRAGSLQAVDAQGVLFSRFSQAPPGVPIVETKADVTADALREAARVVAALRADIAAKVAVIQVGTVDAISLRMRDGRTVQWGSSVDSDQKARVLAVLLKRPAKVIDVSVPGRPTTR